VLLFMCAPGCSGSTFGWKVRTTAIPIAPSFDQIPLAEKPVAILPSLSLGRLQGTEVGVSLYLGEILTKLVPDWNVVSEQASLTGINKHGLGPIYVQMRMGAEFSHLVDRDSLRQIGNALGVRYIFLPRLAGFTQIMTNRAEIPPFAIRLMQTRSSLLRLSLQLWDVETGELVWSGVAETIMQGEALTQEPVFVEDAVRLTFGSLLSDFLNRRTSSHYTPLNEVLNALVHESIPAEQKTGDSGEEANDTSHEDDPENLEEGD
jgi:hypothetical protein